MCIAEIIKHYILPFNSLYFILPGCLFRHFDIYKAIYPDFALRPFEKGFHVRGTSHFAEHLIGQAACEREHVLHSFIFKILQQLQ